MIKFNKKDLINILFTDKVAKKSSIVRLEHMYALYLGGDKVLVTKNKPLLIFIQCTIRNYQEWLINSGEVK